MIFYPINPVQHAILILQNPPDVFKQFFAIWAYHHRVSVFGAKDDMIQKLREAAHMLHDWNIESSKTAIIKRQRHFCVLAKILAQHCGTPFEITLVIKQKIKILITNKMKKSIITLALSVPFAMFAQNDMLNNDNQNNDPFAAINNGNKVSQEYIDIAQTTAVLNIQNTQRGVGNISSGLVNIKRELIDVEQLTNGLKPNSSEDINAFLKR